MQALFQVFISIGLKLLKAQAVEEILFFVAEKSAARTDTKVDDEAVALIKKHVKGK